MKIVQFPFSGCPEAIKLLVGNKSDLNPEVDMTQVRVSCVTEFPNV